ncbi:NAD(P)H-dependent oxidoreductase [Sphingomonas sp. CFBP 13728]|uniref:NAD(P)H-dependent oxidoreductase n=1 Tax=Sphingomonas sp. CFBP 13728 TaxID=2775294 RepID=UPI00177B303C|nr:NAD(P)H-dependent oxidoreductase [Sphingomonas sp. CFBP 13728]MBD8617606.1 NAD(P)H-dependent oxidoreductase [Sphingomonas sp. CFBP 13728]
MSDERSAAGGRHAVILCHPDPSSFNHAIAVAYCDAVRAAGQVVVLRDLYAIGFDPVLKAAERPTTVAAAYGQDVLDEVDAISGCDVFVLVYPIWFGTPPAMLKGYVERVFGAGVQPEALQGRVRTDLLGGKRLLSFSTSAASKIWLDEQGQGQGLNSVFDQYIVHAFGMRSQEHRRFAHITQDLRKQFADQYLRDVAVQAQRTCAQIAFGDEALLADPALVARMAR